MKLRRVFCILLSVIMLFSISACTEGINTDMSDAPNVPVNSDEPTTTSSYYATLVEKLYSEADIMRESILNDTTEIPVNGTIYYVSNSGNDGNDGLTPETAWATTQKVSTTKLNSGDSVLFERGSIFRSYALICQDGVTYSAYGTGKKPIITGSPENGAVAENWILYGETPDGGKVWKYHRNMRDCGTLVLNGNNGVRKIVPYWNGEAFVNSDGTPFDILVGLKQDICFFSPADSLLKQIGNTDETVAGWAVGIPLYEDPYRGGDGALYFRCDEGNPGEIFESIEFSISPNGAGHGLVDQLSNNVFNNLHFFATSDCGFMHNRGDAQLSTIQNCEISFAGGGVLFYDESGRAEMAGDGMNIQRPCLISNNYIHHNADNGITCESGDGERDYHITDISIKGNLFEYNCEDVQFVFFDADMRAKNCSFQNILVTENYMIQAGGGWSSYIRSDEESGESNSSSIKCGDHSTPLYSENLVIRDNVIYSEYARSLLYGGNVGYTPPWFENNRLYLPFGENENGHRVAIALWANDEMQTDGNDFLWIHTDHIWPSDVWMESSEQFLNEYLGSGNTVEYTK